MRDTPAFFDSPPTSGLRLHRRAGGPAGTGRSRHAAVPERARDTASGEQHGRRPLVSGGGRAAARRAQGPRAAPSSCCRSGTPTPRVTSACRRLLARFGVSALRLSLPYHDARMPPELTRADYIVSSNIVRTVQVCRQAVLDARRAVAWLSAAGLRAHRHPRHEPRLVPVDADLGARAAHPRAGAQSRLALVRRRRLARALDATRAAGPRRATSIWSGCGDLWRPISPFSYLDRVRRRETLLVYAKYDLTFPVDLSRTLIDEFRAPALPHEVAVLPLRPLQHRRRRRSSSSTATC